MRRAAAVGVGFFWCDVRGGGGTQRQLTPPTPLLRSVRETGPLGLSRLGWHGEAGVNAAREREQRAGVRHDGHTAARHPHPRDAPSRAVYGYSLQGSRGATASRWHRVGGPAGRDQRRPRGARAAWVEPWMDRRWGRAILGA